MSSFCNGMEAPANDLYVFWHEFMIMNTPLFFEHLPRRLPISTTGATAGATLADMAGTPGAGTSATDACMSMAEVEVLMGSSSCPLATPARQSQPQPPA